MFLAATGYRSTTSICGGPVFFAGSA